MGYCRGGKQPCCGVPWAARGVVPGKSAAGSGTGHERVGAAVCVSGGELWGGHSGPGAAGLEWK